MSRSQGHRSVRVRWLTTLAAISVVASACASSATPSPVPATAVPSVAPTAAAPTTAPTASVAPSASAVSSASATAASTAAAATPSPAASASASAAPTPAGPAGTQYAGRTLNILVDSFREAWDAKVWGPAFEHATGAKINWTFEPFAGIDAKNASLIAAKDSTYDLITSIVTTAPAYRNDLFAPLNGLVDQSLLDDDGSKDAVGNTVYSVGVFDGAQVFYWNKTYFQQAGLDPNTPPKTFDELFADCDKLAVTFPTKHCFDWEMSDPNTTFAYWSLLLNAAGGTMYNDDQSKVAFNSAQGLAAMNTLVKIFKYADPGGYTIPAQTQTGMRFVQGDTMVNFNWDNALPQIFNDPKQSKFVGQVGVSIIPGIGGNTSGSINGWEGYGINTYSNNKDLAAAFINFILSKPEQLAFSQQLGVGTSQKSYLADPTFATNQGLVVRGQQLQYPIGRFGAGFATPVAQLFDAELAKLRKGQETAQQALDALTTSVQQAIDSYNSR